jgi:hypothetical protein
MRGSHLVTLYLAVLYNGCNLLGRLNTVEAISEIILLWMRLIWKSRLLIHCTHWRWAPQWLLATRDSLAMNLRWLLHITWLCNVHTRSHLDAVRKIVCNYLSCYSIGREACRASKIHRTPLLRTVAVHVVLHQYLFLWWLLIEGLTISTLDRHVELIELDEFIGTASTLIVFIISLLSFFHILRC